MKLTQGSGWNMNATPHTHGPRKFLDCFDGTAIMIKGTLGQEVLWRPLPKWLGPSSGFYATLDSPGFTLWGVPRGTWHLVLRGRRIW